MDDNQLSELLDKYVKGLCSPDEAAVINKWYDKHKHQPDILNTLSDEQRILLKSRMLTQVLQQVDRVNAQTKNEFFFNRWWFKAGIAAVLLVSVKIIYSDYFTESATKPEIRQIEVTNNTRQMLKHVLPDKSIVWLDPKAAITFPQIFSNNARNIAMEGDCFFEVTKNPQRPFIIHSEHLITKVWGTSFKISDKKNIANAQVMVVTGKVSVSHQISQATLAEKKIVSGEVILLPRQKVVFKNENNTFYKTKQADISELNRYTHVNLLFDNEKLVNIVVVLNKKFDAAIRIEDQSLKNQVMDADLSGLNLPEVLEVLKASLQLKYEISNDVIILKKTD